MSDVSALWPRQVRDVAQEAKCRSLSCSFPLLFAACFVKVFFLVCEYHLCCPGLFVWCICVERLTFRVFRSNHWSNSEATTRAFKERHLSTSQWSWTKHGQIFLPLLQTRSNSKVLDFSWKKIGRERPSCKSFTLLLTENDALSTLPYSV